MGEGMNAVAQESRALTAKKGEDTQRSLPAWPACAIRCVGRRKTHVAQFMGQGKRIQGASAPSRCLLDCSDSLRLEREPDEACLRCHLGGRILRRLTHWPAPRFQ